MNFDVSRLKDPLFFAENRVAAHSDHVAYASMEELSHGETSLRCSLNGLWKFHHALNAGQVIPGFEAADYDSRGWADIHVPAHIQMEGYGAPQYANVQYPWDGYQAVEIGEIPQEYNPVASYIKTFFVPTQMVGKRVFISFQGAESCIAVWLNGHYVGFSSDSFTPSEFELTDYLVEGENKLACRVERWSAGSWLEDQDFMRFSGIFRDVYLYAIPKAHIADIRVKTLLDDSFTDATLDLAMKMELDAAVGACRVKMALLDGGEVIAAAERVAEGDVLVGMASSGVHSNGYSLVRKLVLTADRDLNAPVEAFGGKSWGETLLTPTKIYVKPALAACKACDVHGIAHITGGGFIENIPRILPDGLSAQIERGTWPVLPVFTELVKLGGLGDRQAYNTFNMGVGMVFAVKAEEADKLIATLEAQGEKAYRIGRVAKTGEDGERLVLL